MPSFIYRLSNLTIMFCCILSVSLFMDLLPKLIQLIPYFRPSEESSNFGHYLFAPVGSSAGLIIGFLLNQSQSNFREVENAVSSEAGRINNLDRLLLRFGDSNSLKIRTELQKYVESIIHEEWPKLKEGQGDKNTHMLWRGTSQDLFKLEPKDPKQLAIYSDILKKSEEISESREYRIDRSTQKLPELFWIVIFLLISALTAINCLFIPSQNMTFALTIVPVTFSGLISLLIITDQPFKGQTSVKPRALEKVLESIKTRNQ
jgi:Protein of unknown function (DUF4239)